MSSIPIHTLSSVYDDPAYIVKAVTTPHSDPFTHRVPTSNNTIIIMSSDRQISLLLKARDPDAERRSGDTMKEIDSDLHELRARVRTKWIKWHRDRADALTKADTWKGDPDVQWTYFRSMVADLKLTLQWLEMVCFRY